MDINECLRSFKFRGPHRHRESRQVARFHDTYTLTGGSHPLVHHTLYFYSITMDDSFVLYDGGDMCHAQSGPLPQAPPRILLGSKEFLRLFCYRGVIQRSDVAF